MNSMSLITLKNVSKSYYSKDVLKDVNLQVNVEEKLAIIGENGTGKTTLFRLILGLEKPDSENAEIVIAKNIIPGYLEQQLQISPEEEDALFDLEIFNLEQKIHSLTQKLSHENSKNNKMLLREYSQTTAKFESLDGYDYQYRLVRILAGLGIDHNTAQRPLEDLSGGERMRVSLARLLIREPDVMLLDEPTNHLDHKAIEWLEKFLQSTKSTVLFISHDRLFIDRVANKTAELSHGNLQVYPGNYSNFLRLKKESTKSLDRQIKKIETDLDKQEEITQTMLSHRKINSYHSSQKKVHKLHDHLQALKQDQQQQATKLKFDITKGIDLGNPDKIILSTQDLSVQFPDQKEALFSSFTWSLTGREKVIIVGQNGCGKTTLLKSILGSETFAKGTVKLTKDINFGFLGQLVEFKEEEQTVLESLLYVDPNLTDGDARNKLAQFGFRSIDVFKSLHTLSGGERSRLYLCHLLSENPDVLFLDEPTNHLDIKSSEILENALLEYEGAILAVSHDRYFIERIGQYLLGFVDKTIQRFENYKEFRQAEDKIVEIKKDSGQRLEFNEDKPKDQKNDAKLLFSEDHQQENESTLGNNDNFYSSSNLKKDNHFSTKRLWTDADIKLQESLAEINVMPSNQLYSRKFKSIAGSTLKDLEKKISIFENKRLQMEADFKEATNPMIYKKYDQLLLLLERHELLYLQLAELVENL